MCVFLRICALTCGFGSVHTEQQAEGNEGSLKTRWRGAWWGGETRRRDLRAGKRWEAGWQPEVGVKRAD